MSGKKYKEKEEFIKKDDNYKESEAEAEAKEDTSEAKADIESEIKQDISENEDLQNKLIRLQADFQNFRKRSEKERENSVNYGIERAVLGILPVIDNFERAIASTNEVNEFYDGIVLIYEHFMNALKNMNVVSFDSKDTEFDPNLHEAISIMHDEKFDDNIIIQELQKGYKLNDKVIRHAVVIVNKKN